MRKKDPEVVYKFVIQSYPQAPRVPARILVYPMGHREVELFYQPTGDTPGGWTATPYPVTHLANEILRLSAALARARAEGRVEGMREAAQIMHKYPDVGLVWERIAAAECELEGNEES